jgi:hypothetical protein
MSGHGHSHGGAGHSHGGGGGKPSIKGGIVIIVLFSFLTKCFADAGIHVDGDALIALRVCRAASVIYMAVSPIRLARHIELEKTTGDFSPLPFIALFTASVAWTAHSVLASDYIMAAAWASGVGLGAYYLNAFRKRCYYPLFSHAVALFVVLASTLAIGLIFTNKSAQLYTRFVGCVLLILACAGATE